MKQKLALIVILVMMGAFLTYGCTKQDTSKPLPPPEPEKKTTDTGNTNKQITDTTKDTTKDTAKEQPKDKTPAVKEFTMTAKQFAFDPATITVNKGDKVRLIVTSTDVGHGFAIPAYNINEKLPVGVPVTIEFTADKAGTFDFLCSVFCGSGHRGMKGQLIVK